MGEKQSAWIRRFQWIRRIKIPSLLEAIRGKMPVTPDIEIPSCGKMESRNLKKVVSMSDREFRIN